MGSVEIFKEGMSEEKKGEMRDEMRVRAMRVDVYRKNGRDESVRGCVL
jgi:hypothetical protein